MKKFLILLLSLNFFLACTEEDRGQYPLDSVAPGKISSVSVTNHPGGALISYAIPGDDDLLYVKALYKLDDGTPMEQKASAYVTQIEIEGLGLAKNQTIQLISGDRSQNESDPVNVEISPLESPIYDILNSIVLKADFGGVYLSWNNPLKSEIVLSVSVMENNNQFTEIQNIYSKASVGKFNIRGFSVEERVFAVFIRDRWMNKTDVVSQALTPLYEEQLDNTQFARWNPQGIPYIELPNWGWTIEKIWDGQLSYASAGYSFPGTVVLPHSFTMDLGQIAQLGRVKLFQRATGDQLYTGGNIKKFQLWGSATPDVNADFSTWTLLGDFESIKPSGSATGIKTQEDIDYATAGEDYTIENSTVPVRYLRFHIEKTWGGSPAMQLFEAEFYGKVQMKN